MADFSREPLLEPLEIAGALFPAAVVDSERLGNSLARRMTRAILREVIGRLRFGTVFPTDFAVDDLFHLTANGTLETYLGKLARTGETSTTVADFAADGVGIYADTFRVAASSAEATAFTSLGSGDKIVLRPEGGDSTADVVLTLSGPPTTGSRNSHPTVNVAASDYTLSGTIADGTAYTVYAITSRAEVKGTIFESDGNYWTRVFEASVPTASIRVDFGTTFPESANTGDIFIFTADVATGLTWKDTDGTTDLTAAARTDIAKYDGSHWVKQLTLAT